MEELKTFDEFLNEGIQDVKNVSTSIKARKFILNVNGNAYTFDNAEAKDLLDKLQKYVDIF